MEDKSNLVLWLADLDINVNNFEDDFSNGFLFGQVLYRYNFQENFGQFSNKPSYSISNISKVQLSLEQFNVKFDPHRIINKEPGYAKKLIEKIHKALHCVNSSPGASRKKNPSKIEKFVDGRLAAKLKKFEEIRIGQAQLALEKEKQQRDITFKTHLKHRSQGIEMLKQNKTFMQTWQLEGMKNWKKNQNRKNERILHENTVKFKIVNDVKIKAEKYNEAHMREADEGINDFEKNMIRLGIDHSGESEKKIVKQDLAIEAAVTMAKIKENKKKNIEAAKEREIRQRNSYIQQQNNEKFEVYKRGSHRFGNFLEKIVRNQEKTGFLMLLKYWKKAKKCEEVERKIGEYQTISEEKWGEINKEHREEIALMESQAKKEYYNKRKLQSEAMIENLKKTHEMHLDLCRPIAVDLIQLADNFFEYLTENKKIPGSLWGNWLNIFKHKSQFNETERSQMTQSNKDFYKETPYEKLSETEINEYLSGKNQWGPAPDNFSLGDIIDNIINYAFPLAPSQASPEGPKFLPYKLIILGPSFAGKKSQSKKLSDFFQLKIFEMPKIIEDAKKIIQKKNEPEDLKNKKKQGEDESEIFVQTSLEVSVDEEIGRSKLFRAKIRGIFGDVPKGEEDTKRQGKKDELKSQGYVLLGYPNTLQEAVDLERQLGGFVHPSELPAEIRDVKKLEASVLVKSSPKAFNPPRLFESAWDLVVLLQIDSNAAVKRAADRRIDPAGNIYNLSINPPPDNLLAKCKTIESPSEDQIRNDCARFEETQEVLIQWFSMFGTPKYSNLLVIDAKEHPDVISEIIKNKLQEISNAKSFQGNDEEIGNGFTKADAEKLFGQWDDLKNKYVEEIGKGLGQGKRCWIELERSLKNLLDEFKGFLMSPDEKQEKALSYVTEFNNMIKEKSVFTKLELEETRKKIDSASDYLWDIVSQRKQNAVTQRESIIQLYNIEEKLNLIGEIALFLCQTEFSRYISSINLIKSYKNLLENSNFSLTTKQVFFQISSPISDSLSLLSLKFSNATENYSFLNEENHLFTFRISKIVSWAKRNVENSKEKVQSAFDTMDAWVVKAVQLENEAINNFICELHEVIDSRHLTQASFPKNSEILLSLSI